MEKRVLLAVSLSFVVLVLYQTLFVRPTPPKPGAGATRPAAAAPAAGTTTAPPPSKSTPAVSSPEPVVPAGILADTQEREIVVESAEVRAVFSNRGATLVRWQLKNYFDDARRPIDLVVPNLSPADERAFTLVAEDEDVTQRLRTALFRSSATSLDVGQGERRLSFDYEDEGGLAVRKTFEFPPTGHPYLVKFTADVRLRGAAVPVAFSSGLGVGDTARAVGSSSFLSPSYYQAPQAIIVRGRDVQRIPAVQIAAQPVQEGTFTAAGSDDHYFLSAVLPGERNTRVTYESVPFTTQAGPRQLVRYRARVAGGLNGVNVFLGPKRYEVLAATDRQLVRTIHFGMFDWLVVPLLQALNWVNGFTGNYGWAIIVLTILINGAIAPLRHRSVVSMRKMQEIQPEVKAIQERYAHLKATDPAKQKMNAEVMNLYREKGVNPASGCLPMLLTMPVLFAFYAMLSQAIEVRGAPFVGWIRDLSTHDPLYVTPLLMGASMVLQQKMTPSTADPVQQRVMMFMPVLFTFMFLWAPSGLVIYWFVSNLWAIGQQYVTNRIIGPPKVVVVRPPAERRVKSAGAERTEKAR
jgi:YidC/Oxa1 family membrane protein insertase